MIYLDSSLVLHLLVFVVDKPIMVNTTLNEVSDPNTFELEVSHRFYTSAQGALCEKGNFFRLLNLFFLTFYPNFP